MGKEYVVYIGHQVGLEIILTKCEDAKLWFHSNAFYWYDMSKLLAAHAH